LGITSSLLCYNSIKTVKNNKIKVKN